MKSLENQLRTKTSLPPINAPSIVPRAPVQLTTQLITTTHRYVPIELEPFGERDLKFNILNSFINKICSRHDIVEIFLKWALNTNQSINQSTCSANC
jgi:hypothetical protein